MKLGWAFPLTTDTTSRGRGWLLIIRRSHAFSALLFALVAHSAFLRAQPDPSLQPEANKPTLERKEGTDPASGAHYVRLLLTLNPNKDGVQTAPPRFTIQCQDIQGKHQLQWFLSFGGVEDPGFEAPFRATKANLYPPRYLGVNVTMTFEGYTKSKPFKRSWSLLPSGELRYRNSGADSPNMESAQYFLQFLSPLPGLRVVRPNPQTGAPEELFFPAKPLLDKLKKTPTCSP